MVWERPEPPNRPAPSPLSRDSIVRAAIDLADADGLPAVSLRKVAAALNAGPMRLYGYLSTKEELLDLMVDAVYGEIMNDDPGGDDWRAALIAIATATRAAANRHEWFIDLVGGRPTLGPNAFAYLEAALSTLDGSAGFTDMDAVMQAVGTVLAYVIGAIRNEITERRAERTTGMTEQQWQNASEGYVARMLTTGKFPTLTRVTVEATHPCPETTFAVGLNYVLDGIATHIPTDTSPS
ncbi:MAG TPA: TetR/AcrR family transcriptional regulator [Pseudonocardiaceae bacterium]|nr:TetR/AcrR family transcriptional regulator [Pseudonocardiaceae bacterium]